MSEFLNDVMTVTRRAGIGNRIDNQVICFVKRDDYGMNFLATDEEGWWGSSSSSTRRR